MSIFRKIFVKTEAEVYLPMFTPEGKMKGKLRITNDDKPASEWWK